MARRWTKATGFDIVINKLLKTYPVLGWHSHHTTVDFLVLVDKLDVMSKAIVWRHVIREFV